MDKFVNFIVNTFSNPKVLITLAILYVVLGIVVLAISLISGGELGKKFVEYLKYNTVKIIKHYCGLFLLLLIWPCKYICKERYENKVKDLYTIED